MSAKSHLKVYVRIRPLSAKEFIESSDNTRSIFTSEVESKVFSKDNSRTTSIIQDSIILFDPAKLDHKKPMYSTRRKKEMKYAFDHVFGEQATQCQVYEKTAVPLIDTVLDGYNATLFAYGATGCGKTHTIVGDQQNPGIIYRTMKDLYKKIKETENHKVYDVSLSYLEVYNEMIRDLLQPDTDASLDLREDETHIVVSGLSSHSPSSADEILAMLVKGNEHRTRAHTESNTVSSRSHAVLQVRVRQRSKTQGISAVWTDAILSIIDLAGSERASATKNRGDRLIEGANINRSLLALGNCINALSEGRKAHIPYRDSKLTRLLKHSLSGNCQVVMIANISPALLHAEETHNTLKYANRAKNIRISLEKNQVDVEYHISQYPVIVAQLQAEIEKLKDAASSVGLSEEGKYIMGKIDNLQQKIKHKEMQRLDVSSQLQWNEWRLDFLNALDTRETDTLHEQNVALRHNHSEMQVALERYTELVENYMKKAKNSLSLSDCECLEQESRLGTLKVQFETKEYQCQLLKSQSQKLAGIITDMIKFKQKPISEVLKEETSIDRDILYDTCTDESDLDQTSSKLQDENDEDTDVFFTPTKNIKIQEEIGTVKAKKLVIETHETTPSLKKRQSENYNNKDSPVIKKLKKRRESMIPTISKRRETLQPIASPRRSRRLTKLPMNISNTSHQS